MFKISIEFTRNIK